MKKAKRGTKKKQKKPWEKPDFEIHSLLDKNLYIRGMACDACCDTCDVSDPGGS